MKFLVVKRKDILETFDTCEKAKKAAELLCRKTEDDCYIYQLKSSCCQQVVQRPILWVEDEELNERK